MRRMFMEMLKTPPVMADIGLLVVRLWLGIVMFAAHGLGKWGKLDTFAAGLESGGYPMPEVMAVLATLAESAGGLFVAIGLLSRPAALTVLVTMLVAALVQHADDGWGKQELPLTFAAMALAIVIAGAGRFSLDHLIRQRLMGRDTST